LEKGSPEKDKIEGIERVKKKKRKKKKVNGQLKIEKRSEEN
jgi:hypothetical protein